MKNKNLNTLLKGLKPMIISNNKKKLIFKFKNKVNHLNKIIILTFKQRKNAK